MLILFLKMGKFISFNFAVRGQENWETVILYDCR